MVDVGLGVRPLADPQRLLEQGVQGGADRAELLADAERVAGLAEDLRLADHHRVQPGGDVEEVGHGPVVVVDVEVRHQRPGRLARALDEQPRDLLHRPVETVDVGVDLQPVAGGDDGRLRDVLGGGHVGDELDQAVVVEGEPLEDGHRRGLVAHTDHEDAHAAPPGSVTAPAPLALRCSW